jgi:hypothetical protein
LQLVFLTAAFGTSLRAAYNLQTGQTLVSASSITAKTTDVGNGWLRCEATATATATATSGFHISLINTFAANAPATSFTGDGVSGIYLWGAQLEAGAFATSYIPTVASQVTRSADVAVMTGTNFSDWYNQTEGSFYVNCSVVRPSSSSVLGVDDGTSSNRTRMGNTGTGAGQFVGVVSTVSQWSIASSAGSFPLNTPGKMAMAYKVNDIAATSNAGAVGTDTSATIPTVSQLTIGTANSSFYGSGHIRQLAYYPRRLADSELTAITS